jgi:hypothetical protein
VPFTLIGSRLSFDDEEGTGNFHILKVPFSKCEVKSSINHIPNLLSNSNSDFLINPDLSLYRPLSGQIFTFSKKTQKCDESAIIDLRIGKEKSKMKFESNEIDGQTIYLRMSLCGIVEEFNCFKISILGYIEVILSTEYSFADVSTLWSTFETSQNDISDCNIDLKSFCKKEVNVINLMNIERIYFVNMKDGMDCDLFFSKFFVKMRGNHQLRNSDIFVHQLF